MKYSRDALCEIHGVQVVETNSPQEAAKKIKEEITSVDVQNAKEIPKYLYGKEDIDILPELWDENIRFFDEEGNEYDSHGVKVPDEYNEEEHKSDDENTVGDTHFIWGIKSYDDMTFAKKANMYTMNDIDVVKQGDKYLLGIEEVYLFNREKDRIEYLEHLEAKFREWILSLGYKEEDIANLRDCSCFTHFYPSAIMEDITTFEASTPIDLYKKYKLFIISYKAIAKEILL